MKHGHQISNREPSHVTPACGKEMEQFSAIHVPPREAQLAISLAWSVTHKPGLDYSADGSDSGSAWLKQTLLMSTQIRVWCGQIGVTIWLEQGRLVQAVVAQVKSR